MKSKYLLIWAITVLFLFSCSFPRVVQKDTPAENIPLGPVSVDEKPIIDLSQYNSIKIKSLQEITPENVYGLNEIMNFGNGVINDCSYSTDGSSIIASTSIGISIYDGRTLDLKHYFETETSMGTIAVSPDNRTVAVSNGYRDIHLFDIKSNSYLGIISRVDQTIYGFAFVNNGQELVIAETNESVHYWDVTTLTHSRSVSASLTGTMSFAASADGKLFAIETHEDNLIHVWDGEDGVEILTISKPENFTKIRMAISPDNKKLVATYGKSLLVWNIENGELISDLSSFYEGESSYFSVFFLSFSPNGDNFMAFSPDKVDLWDTTNFNLITSVPYNLEFSTLCAASTPDNGSVVVGTLDGTISTYEVASGQKTGSATNQMSVFTSVAIAPDENQIAAGDMAGRVLVYDLESQSLKLILAEHQDAIKALAFSPDGNNLASSSEEEGIITWDTSSGTVTNKLYGFAESIALIDYSPDGTILAASENYQKKIYLVDTQSGAVVRTLDGGGVSSLNFSPDGTSLTAISGDDLSAWSTNGELLYHDRIETGYEGLILHIGTDSVLWAAVEVDDVGIRIWAPLSEMGNEVLVPHDNYAKDDIKFSPNSQLLAYSSGLSIQLIDANNGEKLKLLLPFKMDPVSSSFISSFKFSKSGKLIVAASEGGTISIFGTQ